MRTELEKDVILMHLASPGIKKDSLLYIGNLRIANLYKKHSNSGFADAAKILEWVRVEKIKKAFLDYS
jgi:hypothetical protein